MYVRMPPRFGASATAATGPKARTAHNTNFKLEQKCFHIASERSCTAGRLIARDLCVPSCLPIASSSAYVLQLVSCLGLIFPLKRSCAIDLECMISGLTPRRIASQKRDQHCVAQAHGDRGPFWVRPGCRGGRAEPPCCF